MFTQTEDGKQTVTFFKMCRNKSLKAVNIFHLTAGVEWCGTHLSPDTHTAGVEWCGTGHEELCTSFT